MQRVLYNIAEMSVLLPAAEEKAMEESATRIDTGRTLIESKCLLFVCRCCRTKVGWPHQSWCAHAASGEFGCEDCFYFDHADTACRHPMRKREERAAK